MGSSWLVNPGKKKGLGKSGNMQLHVPRTFDHFTKQNMWECLAEGGDIWEYLGNVNKALTVKTLENFKSIKKE